MALLALGCSDATGPGRSPAGTFDLVSIQGKPLPFDNGSSFILSGTLTMGRGTWELTTILDIFAPHGAPVGAQTDTVNGGGRFDHDGDSIEFEGGITGRAEYDGESIGVPLTNPRTGERVAGVARFERR